MIIDLRKMFFAQYENIYRNSIKLHTSSSSSSLIIAS
jgi:hypothetical protein